MPSDRDGAATVVAAILGHAAPPDRTAFTFPADGEAVAGRLTCGGLAEVAGRAARSLRARVARGDRVLLVHPPGLDFVCALLATLAAGAVAVPAPLAASGRANRARLLAIAADCRPALAVTTPEPLDARGMMAPVPVTTVEALGAEDGGGPDAPPGPELGPGIGSDDLALLQYTSGSTGAPKGVMVSHAAIMANQALIRRRFGHSEATVTVGWLPMFHDMGLIGEPCSSRSLAVLMPPLAFLQEPVRWLRAIHRFGRTTAVAPNFAYALCAARVTPAQREGLDLSGWRVAFNGSEPVRAATPDRFASAFAPQGFRREALFPCYGMAEATLFVAGADRDAAPHLKSLPDGRTLVGCGRTRPGHEVLIIDPKTLRPRPDGVEGEVWFREGSIASGCWGRPEDTARLFGARVRGRDWAFLRTGDLGLAKEDELFVTGRIKDLIIVRGRNHPPRDIEATVGAAHPGLRLDGAAAFAVAAEDRPQLVVV